MITAYQRIHNMADVAKTEDEFENVRIKAFRYFEVGTINKIQYEAILSVLGVRKLEMKG